MSLWANLAALPGHLWRIARDVERLFEMQKATRETLDVLSGRIERLEQRMTYLEANEHQVVTEAKAAASAASTMVAGSILSDVVTRLTRLEVRVDTLPSPSGPARLQTPP